MEYRGAYRWAAIWIAFCVWCQCVPWLLSAAGWLKPAGYLVAIAISLAALGRAGRRRIFRFRIARRPIRNRWVARVKRQPVFGVWLLLLLAAFVGGLLHPPTNHDGLTYRFPRILHWFWEGRWHWIENPAEPQMNLSTHGFEWLTAFFFALTGSDRLFFVINLVSFALLPGLLFALLTRLGAGGRVASWWMWIFPSGYGIALQAGGIGNDLFAIPYVLAGMVFALRARESRRMRDIVLAILAAALVTGTKLSNVPLVLPVAVALAGNLSWVLRWRNAPALIGANTTGLAASAAPVLIACIMHTGHFSGDPGNRKNLNIENPVAGVVANSLQVLSRNFMPPVNPAASWWNARYQSWLPGSVRSLLAEDYPRFHLRTVELPQEEGDGLGLGVTLLVLCGVGLAVFAGGRRKPSCSSRRRGIRHWPISVAVAAATAVYLLKMGSEAAPRLMLPYYALLLVPVLGFGVNTMLVRAKGWQAVATVAACFVLPAMILSPNRPLIPVRTILAQLPEPVREKPAVKRIATVYETYARRHDAMAPLRNWLPGESRSGTDRIAFVGDGRSLRTGLWRPFGSRKVETLETDPRIESGRYSAVVVDLAALGEAEPESWAGAIGFRVAAVESIPNYAGKPRERYAVLVPAEAGLSAAD